MTISYVSVGAVASGASSISPAYGTGNTAGRLACLAVASAHPADLVPTQPDGWTMVSSYSGGGGTYGSGAGPRRLTWFVRVLLGSDATPTVSFTSGTGSVLAGRIMILSRSAGTGWVWDTVTGQDTTAAVSLSAVTDDSGTFAPNDMCLWAAVVPQNYTFTVEAVTLTGTTWGAFTELADEQIAVGNLLHWAVGYLSEATGTISGSPTLSATASGSVTGVVGVLRVREATAALTTAVQSSTPPRVALAVTGMKAQDTVTLNLYRRVGSTTAPRQAVRGNSTATDETGVDTDLRIDAEQPLGVDLYYEAELLDANGGVWIYTAPALVNTAFDSVVISDAISGLGARVVLQAWADKKRTRDSAQFNCSGRIVTVSKPRSAQFTSTITVRTVTSEDADDLDAVLAAATEGVVLLRAAPTDARVDCYLAVTDDTETPMWYDDPVFWDLTVVQSDAWPDALDAASATLQQIADNYASLQAISDANATLLILAERFWS